MFPRILAAVILAALVLPAALNPSPGTVAAAPAVPFTVSHLNFTSFDNTKIAFTVFQPATATPLDPAPVIVRSHGWAGSRETEAPVNSTIWKFLQAGYGVVTFDARGHGESGGVARIHDMDYEIKDVSLLLTNLTGFPWVKTDAPGDPRVGASGGSYGGGWQLLTASVDPRLDVLVPEITWHSLPQSLAPNGAPKTLWIDVLYTAGKGRARLAPEIDTWYREVKATNAVPADAYEQLWDNSPGKHIASINRPTLLIQGVMDTLFNLNEAADTYRGIAANGAPVALVTHTKEHADLPTNPEALRARANPEPCGKAADLALAWYDFYLRGLPVTPSSGLALARDDGTCVRLSGFDSVPRLQALASDFAVVTGELLLPLPVAAGSAVAGIPHLRMVRHGSSCEAVIVYASLVAVGSITRVLDDQVIPWRQSGGPGCVPALTSTVTLEMGGVAARVGPGEVLALRLSLTDPQFAASAERVQRPLILSEIEVDLPVIPPAS